MSEWTNLDLYHGIVQKIEEMDSKGKFNGYVYQYHNQLMRGSDENFIVRDIRETESKTGTFKSLLYEMHMSIFDLSNASSQTTKKDVILHVKYSSTFQKDGTPTDDIVIFQKIDYIANEYLNLNFNFKELRDQRVDLATVLTHYFEHAYMEVPPFRFVDYHRHLGTNFVLTDRFQFERKYRWVLRYLDMALAFAMSQHKRLGPPPQSKGSLRVLPNESIENIAQHLRPNFNVVEDYRQGMSIPDHVG